MASSDNATFRTLARRDYIGIAALLSLAIVAYNLYQISARMARADSLLATLQVQTDGLIDDRREHIAAQQGSDSLDKSAVITSKLMNNDSRWKFDVIDGQLYDISVQLEELAAVVEGLQLQDSGNELQISTTEALVDSDNQLNKTDFRDKPPDLQAKVTQRKQQIELARIDLEASLNNPASYDWEWAKNTEASIEQALARPLNIAGVESVPSASSIQCGGLLCKVEFRIEDPNDINSYNALLARLSGGMSKQVSGISIYSKSNGDGSVTNSFYLKRSTKHSEDMQSLMPRASSRLN